MALTEISIKGAREHNLKNIDLTIPRDELVVITGLSGSGKSSLAFDTIYAPSAAARSSARPPTRSPMRYCAWGLTTARPAPSSWRRW